MSNEGPQIFADHCNTVYIAGNGYGDIGQNIAENRPNILGVTNRDDFVNFVSEIHEEGLTERESDGLGYILAHESPEESDLAEVIWEGAEAQHPEDYADGFIELCRQDYDVDIVTAGIEEIAEITMNQRMNGYTPEVVGTRLTQENGIKQVEAYCSGDLKIEALKQKYDVETLSDIPSIALGNSDSNDGPMMEEAVIGIGRGRAFESADLYTEDDSEFWTRGTLVAITSAALENGRAPEKAGREFMQATGNPSLEEVELGGNSGEEAKEILDIYEKVKAVTP